jgi:lambda repressor-like predicted transcriptional regulator
MRRVPALEASASPASLDDRYFPLRELSTYAGLSVRTLRNCLKHLSYPLPCYRIGGKVLVRKSDYDAWAARFRAAPSSRVDAIVSDVIRGL